MKPTKKGKVVLGTSALLASVLMTGCDSDSPSYNKAGVCMDSHTHKRLADSNCDHSSHSGSITPVWVYYGMGRNIAPIGGSLSGYSTTTPRENYVRGGFPSSGGTFNSSSKIASGAKVFDGSGAKAGSAGKAVGSIGRGGFGAHAGGEGHGG